ncbi:MAG: DUF438 domain-containing protein [Clostridiales bacterium]|nr:DUF438 domain-containing protein [Clostridiales bacterium]
MSEYINNREHRQKILKELILELHDGKTVDEVKERFGKLIEGVSAMEISAMETALINDGMPVSEVQRLCDVHASVFDGSIQEIHQADDPGAILGHPINTFKLENRAIERFIKKKLNPIIAELKNNNSDVIDELKSNLTEFYEIDKHYSRKENLVFPYLEKYGITAPPKVMWGVDDEIRNDIKECIALVSNKKIDNAELASKLEAAIIRVEEMISKEENILLPMVQETLVEDEWLKIARESEEIGYCLSKPIREWVPVHLKAEDNPVKASDEPVSNGLINLETGSFDLEELEAMLNAMPVDITFVDKNGKVKYFSQGTERIFPRTKAVIGREVNNCHPPASVHVVEQIVEDLKSGKKDHEDFWIKMKDRFVYIRYFAVRNKDGEYMGVLEFTQNISEIRELEGEKRLVED